MFSNRRISYRRHFGISLIEVLLFIVIVGIAVSGMLAAFRLSVQKSTDPLARKQVIAIAESMMEEVQLMPFTFCDPDDANARTATSATVGVGGCAATAEALGPEAGENRYGTGGVQFDNVNDYHGYDSATEAPTGIKDISGTPIATLADYNVSVNISNVPLGANPDVLLLIQVTVTGPDSVAITFHGYRSRYAPRSPL